MSVALAAAALVGACGGHAHRHGGQPSGPQAMQAAGPPTAAPRTTESLAVLPSGYKKVAAPAGAALYFINLRPGDVVASPLRVQFGLRGMGVAPAGIEKDATGHHHLLVNVGEIDVNAPLPANDQHRHFGAGQTEVTLDLKPGTYTLQLLLGDHNHIPHHPPVMSERISVTVK